LHASGIRNFTENSLHCQYIRRRVFLENRFAGPHRKPLHMAAKRGIMREMLMPLYMGIYIISLSIPVMKMELKYYLKSSIDNNLVHRRFVTKVCRKSVKIERRN